MSDIRGWAKDIIVGALIGIASMLPGISGATLAVVMGIYERLIRDLADLRRWLIEDFRFIFVLAVGFVIGTVASAKLLNGVMTDYPAECLLFFLGLILGQIPALWATTGISRERTPTGWETAAFLVGIAVMAVMIYVNVFVTGDSTTSISHDIGGYLIMIAIGVVIALSALAPGISHSTVLVVLGLYGTFTHAIGDFDIGFVACMGAGAVAGLLLFSKFIHNALENHHTATMLLTIGLTIGSVVSVIIMAWPDLNSAFHIVASIITLAAGIAVSVLFMKMDSVKVAE